MSTSRELYERKDKGTGAALKAYSESLDAWGAPGKLAHFLLFAQRAVERYHKARGYKIVDKDWLRLKEKQMLWAMNRLIQFCEAAQPSVPFRMKRFNYGIRIKPARRVRMVRFRYNTRKAYWKADEANLQIICDFCDSLVQDEHPEPTGTLFEEPTPPDDGRPEPLARCSQ